MKTLIIGDVVGKVGRNTLKEYLKKNRKNYDFVIVNGENSASGFGITPKIVEEYINSGVDVITSGNHIWDRKEIIEYIGNTDVLLRPLNYGDSVPGEGIVKKTVNGSDIYVINLSGRIFMTPADCPFKTINKYVKDIPKNSIVIVDFHAEATSEKIALGYYLNGKVSLVFGTHTHVQTADENILDRGTGYISDIGMTGGHDGVIGVKKEKIIDRFITGMPQRFEVEEDKVKLCGIEAEFNEKGKCVDIKRINLKIDEI